MTALHPFRIRNRKERLLGGTKENSKRSFYKKRTAKIEHVSRPGPAVEDAPEEAPTIRFPKKVV